MSISVLHGSSCLLGACGAASAVCLLDAGDCVEEVAEGELDELDSAALRLVAPNKGRVTRFRQDLVLATSWLRPCWRCVGCIGRGRLASIARLVEGASLVAVKLLFGPLKDFLNAVELNRSDFCADCE